jgi:hypothetical protein
MGAVEHFVPTAKGNSFVIGNHKARKESGAGPRIYALTTGYSRLTGSGVCINGVDSQAPRHPRDSPVSRGWQSGSGGSSVHAKATQK